MKYRVKETATNTKPTTNTKTTTNPTPSTTTGKTMVPAAINTYLREYQRDGVRFFWDMYKDGKGGLLGDDMGLVGSSFLVLLVHMILLTQNDIFLVIG